MPKQAIQFQPFFRPVQKGSGFLSKGLKFAKKTGLASKGLKLAGIVTGDDRLKKAGKVAKTVGLGRRRRRR